MPSRSWRRPVVGAGTSGLIPYTLAPSSLGSHTLFIEASSPTSVAFLFPFSLDGPSGDRVSFAKEFPVWVSLKKGYSGNLSTVAFFLYPSFEAASIQSRC